MKKILFLIVIFFAFNSAYSQLVSWSKSAKNMGDTVKSLATQNITIAAVTEKGYYSDPKINISSLPTGLYFVKIRNKINKFIKL